MKTREYWLDYLRALACALVAIGHLVMSFQESGILQNEPFSGPFIRLLYLFHVYIFFFCSGYLFQKNRRIHGRPRQTLVFKAEKCLDFLILYILYSGVTYLVKILFSDGVNSQVEGGFGATLLFHPINQMWYLYAIAAIFLFAHCLRSDTSLWVMLGIAAVLKAVSCIPWMATAIPIPFNYLCQNAVWFVLGQACAYRQRVPSRTAALVCLLLFGGLFAVTTAFARDAEWVRTGLTLLGLLAAVGLVHTLTRHKTAVSGVWKYLSKYMLPIYLLHTLFAAGIRILLLKVGVTHLLPHLVLGLAFSFVPPILCAAIAERTRVLNVFFFPVKTVKEWCAKKE